jgi:iron(III) transport system ATP-binding protein
VVTLLGPSGCGKTTALRLIAGFDNPDSGLVTIGGQCVFQPGCNLPPEKRRIGMVFQEGALFPHLTVEQNVGYGLPRRDGRKERVQQVLAMVSLEHLGHRMPHELSGGQQQRVALARALAPQPEVLLLDEPFSNLDPGLRERVRRDVLEILRTNGVTAIFVTHDQEEALFVGDEIAVMRNGRIEQIDSPEEIFHHPATRFVAEFIGTVDFLPGWRSEDRLMTEVGSVEWPEASPADTGVEVMVRPDCLECYPCGEGAGLIVSREFRGAFYLYKVSLPSGSSVRCLLPHTQEYAVGTRVTVELRCGHSLLPFIGGQAIYN